jgi:hypothetical protein
MYMVVGPVLCNSVGRLSMKDYSGVGGGGFLTPLYPLLASVLPYSFPPILLLYHTLSLIAYLIFLLPLCICILGITCLPLPFFMHCKVVPWSVSNIKIYNWAFITIPLLLFPLL